MERIDEMKKMKSRGASHSEISRQFGLSRERIRQILGNAGNKKVGCGLKKKNKDSSTTSKGILAEFYVSEKLNKMGIRNKIMPYDSPYDLLLNNGKRVEVKFSLPRLGYNGASKQYTFRTEKDNRRGKVDFYVFVLWDTKEIFVVPFKYTPNHVSLCWPKVSRITRTGIDKYHNCFDLLR